MLLQFLAGDALPGVELLEGARYGRTVGLEGQTGVVFAADAPGKRRLNIDVSHSLLPALMPLIARLRHVFDLDAEPGVIDAHLEEGGLGALVRRRPGVRLPGAFDGFEAVLRVFLGGPGRTGLAGRMMRAIGGTMSTTVRGLTHLAPTAERVADAGVGRLETIGWPSRQAEALAATARQIADGGLRLRPGDDVAAARRGLLAIDGMDDRLVTMIVMRALYWPDAFPASDPVLKDAVGVRGTAELKDRAESWRPWRAYAALHLWLNGTDRKFSALPASTSPRGLPLPERRTI